MARSQWIDDTYYVGSSGARASNRWVWAGEDSDAPSSDGGWFYLDANGRMVTDTWRVINDHRYHFDSDGRMSYGWLTDEDGSLYYLGDEKDVYKRQCLCRVTCSSWPDGCRKKREEICSPSASRIPIPATGTTVWRGPTRSAGTTPARSWRSMWRTWRATMWCSWGLSLIHI